MLGRPRIRRVERFMQLVHALHLPGMRGGVIVDEELARFTHALGHRLEDRLPRFERRLLGDARELQCGSEPDLAVVGPRAARDDLQQARLARAVASDEPDVLARLDDEIRVVEQRNVAVGEGDFRKLC